jgi:hypothetical protein
MRTIKINGKKYPYLGFHERRSILRSKGRFFVMFPAVRNDSDRIDPLPEIGPQEIHRITSVPPDITRRHAQEVRQMFEARRAHYSSAILEEHLRTNPHDAGISEQQFKDACKEILAQSLDDYRKDPLLRECIWLGHATTAQAEKVGYLDLAEQAVISSRFKRQGLTPEQSREEIRRLKYVALYDNPQRTKLYLYGLKEEPILNERPRSTRQKIRVRATPRKLEWHSEDYQMIYLRRGN